MGARSSPRCPQRVHTLRIGLSSKIRHLIAIIADSKRMQTPVLSACVTNFNFPELLQIDKKSPLRDVMLWVLEFVTASTEYSLMGQAVMEYWACDFES
mmetsp:Transcript_9848/g.19261  ORF Transcript_9848/g.19261 Transcript_9848/m.19261 type:complete len:98 (+) Transcript_9848:695-988(+)